MSKIQGKNISIFHDRYIKKKTASILYMMICDMRYEKIKELFWIHFDLILRREKNIINFIQYIYIIIDMQVYNVNNKIIRIFLLSTQVRFTRV